MKKKLICMLLIVMMISSLVLSSCSLANGSSDEETGTDTDIEDMSNRTPVTITLWLPTLDGTTDEAVALVQDELNSHFKTSFTTAVQLKAIPEDEYVSAVYSQLDKIQELENQRKAEESRRRELAQSRRKAGITTAETETETVEQTTVNLETNDIGYVDSRYPTVGEYQFDIFLVLGYDMYKELADDDKLAALDDNLNSTSKVLKSYIYPTFLSAYKDPLGTAITYAIPNNHGMGEYKFMLINRELALKYDYDPEAMTTFAAATDLIRDVARYEEDDSVAPLLSWVDPAGMTYWSEDGSWSVLSSLVPNLADVTANAPLTNIFRNAEYKANFKLMKEFEENGMIAEDPENCEKFAVGVVSSDSFEKVVEEYGEDYVVVTYETPRATQADIFESAFAVSSSSSNLQRCMEVITAINTDPEIRNILQYGVEGVHYELNDDNQVHRLSNEYMMNIRYTGNTYMAYTEEGMDPNQWEYDKTRNQYTMMTPYTYVGGLFSAENEQYYSDLAKISQEYYDKMMATSLEDADEFFSTAATEVSENEAFANLGGGTWEYGPATLYNTFYSENFAVEEEEPGAETGAADTTPAE